MHEIEIKLNDYHTIKKHFVQKPKFSIVRQEPSIHSKAFAYIEEVKVNAIIHTGFYTNLLTSTKYNVIIQFSVCITSISGRTVCQ